MKKTLRVYLYPLLIVALLSYWWMSFLLSPTHVNVDVENSQRGVFQLFWDHGNGPSEENSVMFSTDANQRLKASVPISVANLKFLRIDPNNSPGESVLRNLSIKVKGNIRSTPIWDFVGNPQKHIENLTISDQAIKIAIQPNGYDALFFVHIPEIRQPGKFELIAKVSISLLFIGMLGLLLAWKLMVAFEALDSWVVQTYTILSSGIWNICSKLQSTFSKPEFSIYHHLIFVALLTITFLHYRYSSIPFIGSYGDETHKWLHAKMMMGEIPLSEWHWDHHTARLTIIFMTWITQLLFGTSPEYYYIIPFVVNLVIIYSIYYLGNKITHPVSGFIAGMMCIFWSNFPATQLMPSPFAAMTLALTTVALFNYLDAKTPQKERFHLGCVSILAILAYLSWISTVFAFPAIAIIIAINKGFKKGVLFTSFVIAGFLIETLCYNLFAGIRLGRLDIIMNNHMDAVDYAMTWKDLFSRYSYLNGLYQKIFYGFLLSLPFVIILRKWMPKKLFLFIWVPGAFYFFLTFCIKSLDPLGVVLNHARPRYAFPGLPLLFLYYGVLGTWFLLFIKKLPKGSVLLSPLLMSILAIIGTVHLNNGINESRNPKSTLPYRLSTLKHYQDLANNAFDDGVTILQTDSENAKGTKFFVDILLKREKQTSSPEEWELLIRDRYARVILPSINEKGFSSQKDEDLRNLLKEDFCLILYQLPFKMGFGTVSGIGKDKKRKYVNLTYYRFDHPIPYELRSTCRGMKLDFLNDDELKIEIHHMIEATEAVRYTRSREAKSFAAVADAKESSITLTVESTGGDGTLRLPFKRTGKNESFSITVVSAEDNSVLMATHESPPPSTVFQYFDIPYELFRMSNKLIVNVEIVEIAGNPEERSTVGLPLWIR